MPRMRRANKIPRPKKVTTRLAARLHGGETTEPYRMMEAIVAQHRTDLKEAKIAIAWRKGWRRNADGFLQMGACKKRGDLDRELAAYDFVLLLNEDAWPALSEAQRERLIFHELEHAQIKLDDNGEQARDERGRLVCRVRKHDFEEFRSVVEKYGLGENLADVAEHAMAAAKTPLFVGAKATKAKRKAAG